MENKKAINWFNSIGLTKRNELALEHFGVDADLLMDDEINSIYNDVHRYFIEFDGKRRYLSLFPAPDQGNNRIHKTINEALDYMILLGAKEITIRN